VPLINKDEHADGDARDGDAGRVRRDALQGRAPKKKAEVIPKLI